MIKINHKNQPVLMGGVPVERARAAMIMLHGRGATAQSILSLADQFGQPDFTYLATQAEGNSWYPYRFLEPIERNEPGISSTLQVIDELISQMNRKNVSTRMIMLLGFSQGACLVLEYAVRYPQLYGGIVGLSGGLIVESVRPVYYSLLCSPGYHPNILINVFLQDVFETADM